VASKSGHVGKPLNRRVGLSRTKKSVVDAMVDLSDAEGSRYENAKSSETVPWLSLFRQPGLDKNVSYNPALLVRGTSAFFLDESART
jgi:hypothetical protein